MLLIGTGFVGRVHLKRFAAWDSWTLAAIVYPNLATVQKYADEFGVEKCEADFHKILADPSIDAVEIYTPNTFHAPSVEGRANSRRQARFVCEKPLRDNLCSGRGQTRHATTSKKLRNLHEPQPAIGPDGETNAPNGGSR